MRLFSKVKNFPELPLKNKKRPGILPRHKSSIFGRKKIFFYSLFGEITRLQPKEKVLQKEPDGNVNFSCRNFHSKMGEKKGVKFDRQNFFMVNGKNFYY